MIDSIHLSKALTERFGLGVSATAEQISEGQKVVIRPTNIEHTISFQVELVLGWRKVSAVFKPGNYAATLVKSMNDATQEQKAAFSVFAYSLRSKGARVDLLLDRASADPTTPESWTDDWQNITIGMKKIGVILEKDSVYDFKEAFPWATGFFGMSLALLPLEEIPDEEVVGEAEGSHYFRRVKRYERSRINRAACIEIHGTACNICGFSFGEVFGGLGEGFIHIHHIVPVSETGGKYILNPRKDLIPVCPNCHAMLHRRKVVLFPNELKEILAM
jgi:5-methylcytosine-specific restriction enzyme A